MNLISYSKQPPTDENSPLIIKGADLNINNLNTTYNELAYTTINAASTVSPTISLQKKPIYSKPGHSLIKVVKTLKEDNQEEIKVDPAVFTKNITLTEKQIKQSMDLHLSRIHRSSKVNLLQPLGGGPEMEKHRLKFANPIFSNSSIKKGHYLIEDTTPRGYRRTVLRQDQGDQTISPMPQPPSSFGEENGLSSTHLEGMVEDVNNRLKQLKLGTKFPTIDQKILPKIEVTLHNPPVIRASFGKRHSHVPKKIPEIQSDMDTTVVHNKSQSPDYTFEKHSLLSPIKIVDDVYLPKISQTTKHQDLSPKVRAIQAVSWRNKTTHTMVTQYEVSDPFSTGQTPTLKPAISQVSFKSPSQAMTKMKSIKNLHMLMKQGPNPFVGIPNTKQHVANYQFRGSSIARNQSKKILQLASQRSQSTLNTFEPKYPKPPVQFIFQKVQKKKEEQKVIQATLQTEPPEHLNDTQVFDSKMLVTNIDFSNTIAQITMRDRKSSLDPQLQRKFQDTIVGNEKMFQHSLYKQIQRKKQIIKVQNNTIFDGLLNVGSAGIKQEDPKPIDIMTTYILEQPMVATLQDPTPIGSGKNIKTAISIHSGETPYGYKPRINNDINTTPGMSPAGENRSVTIENIVNNSLNMKLMNVDLDGDIDVPEDI